MRLRHVAFVECTAALRKIAFQYRQRAAIEAPRSTVYVIGRTRFYIVVGSGLRVSLVQGTLTQETRIR